MTHSRTMTIGRQILAALAVVVLLMLLIAAVGVLALNRVGDAKDSVIDREVQLVVEAYRLDLAVADRGVAVRNLLVTGDAEQQVLVDEADADFRRAFSVLSQLVDQSDGRALLADISARKADLDGITTDLVARRIAGEIVVDDLADVIRGELAPVRAALADVVEDFVEREQQAIARSIASSDATVRDTNRLLVGLSALGVVLALGIGGWLARNVRRMLSGYALNIDVASSEILAGTAQQAAAAAEQAAAVQQTVATSDELAQTAGQSAERARAVADAAQRATDIAGEGTVAVNESAAAMEQIRQQVDVIASTVVSLAERAQDISSIVRAVDDLSEQIHLLALNASIEAARAGEHGRGFSVVATEVRALADQSKRATNEIAGILSEIQHGTNTAVMATEEGNKSANAGVERVHRAGATIEQLAATVAESAFAAEQISASSGQQAVATSQISHAMRDMDDTAQQNAAAARQAEQAARDLSEVAAGLKALVGAR